MPDASAEGIRRGPSWRRAVAASTLLICLLPPATNAQTASSVTPESFQPPLQNLSGSVVFTGQAGTQAPPGSEQIGVTLSGVNLVGAFPQMAAANSTFETRLTRGRIPVSELFDATSELEATYTQAGFPLVRVVLPQQSLRDGGVLRVEVVDGFVETIDTSRVPPNVRARIEGLTAPLVGRPNLTMAQLERQLLLAGDVSGVALGSALTAGLRPGGTIIALDPEYRRVTGFVGFDNFAPSELGSIAPDDLHGLVFNSGVEVNSPFGYGETLYGRLSASPQQLFSDNPRYRVMALGAMVPIGTSGLALNFELTSSDTTPDSDGTRTRSDFDRQSLRVIYPWIRSRSMNLTSQFIVDRQRDKQKIMDGDLPIFEDKLTVLRLGTTLSYNHDDGSLSEVGAVLSRGVDALGARTAADAEGDTPLSRQGADATFSKLSGSFTHQRAIQDRFTLGLTGRFQTSFGDPLLTSEQFSISGPGELSAFDTGELRGDSGWVVRAEFSSPRNINFRDLPLVVSPYVFAGAGSVSIEQPTDLETSRENAHAFGIGVDLLSQGESRYRSSSLRVEYGRGEREDGPDNTRFSLSGNFRF